VYLDSEVLRGSPTKLIRNVSCKARNRYHKLTTMIKKSITIKSSDFRYPTKEERAKINAECQKLTPFGFEYCSEIVMLIQDQLTPEEVKRKSDLFEWDICLLNKLGKLKETYLLLNSSYQRGKSTQTKNKKAANEYLFDYYTEIYYFYFFSARDLIAQIINVFYKLKIEDKDVDFHKLANNKNLNLIKDILTDFSEATKMTSDIRNSFTHRFPSNYPDSRSVIINDNGRIGYGFCGGKRISPEDFIFNISESHKKLAELIIKLKVEFNKK
jgi:hypothetical protein